MTHNPLQLIANGRHGSVANAQRLLMDATETVTELLSPKQNMKGNPVQELILVKVMYALQKNVQVSQICSKLKNIFFI